MRACSLASGSYQVAAVEAVLEPQGPAEMLFDRLHCDVALAGGMQREQALDIGCVLLVTVIT